MNDKALQDIVNVELERLGGGGPIAAAVVEGVPCDGVEVAEADGAVILSGRAASWFDRDAAERLAWTLPGVQSVDNRITLPPEAVRPDAAAAAPPA